MQRLYICFFFVCIRAMNHDHLACQKSDLLMIAWRRRIESDIVDFAKSRFGMETKVSLLAQGAFNRCYMLESKVVRFPVIGRTAFLKEKVIDETFVHKFLSKYTSIPLPRLIAVEDTSWGPCIIMEFVSGDLLADKLRHALVNLQDERTIRQSYKCMAETMIELSKCQFDRIGGISQSSSKVYQVSKRPLSLDFNQLVINANYPPNRLPPGPFTTTRDYLVALAQRHITHMNIQRNDAYTDVEDCRKRFVARFLFLKMAETFVTDHNEGPFSLFCDDLRPSNVLVDDELNVQAFIDWEFTYAAPIEFSQCAPWWLLLVHPDDWESGLDSFISQFSSCLPLFLQEIAKVEDELISRGKMTQSERLSTAMEQSMKNNNFWFCLAATSSFSFDDIYWQFLDEAHFGKFTSIEDRIALLSEDEQSQIENLVQSKLSQPSKLEDYRTIEEMLAS